MQERTPDGCPPSPLTPTPPVCRGCGRTSTAIGFLSRFGRKLHLLMLACANPIDDVTGCDPARLCWHDAHCSVRVTTFHFPACDHSIWGGGHFSSIISNIIQCMLTTARYINHTLHYLLQVPRQFDDCDSEQHCEGRWRSWLDDESNPKPKQ